MRIEGSFDLMNNTNISDIMSRLDIGDTVRAKVMDIAGNELLLKLFDGTTVKASMLSSVNIKQGEIVEFIIKNKSESRLFLETLKNNGQKILSLEDEIKSELLGLGLKPDKRNIEAAKELKNNNTQLDRETIKKVLDAVVKFKDLTFDKAAFLVSKGISPGEKAIQSLNQLAFGTKIEARLTELMDQIIGIDDKKLLSIISQSLESVDLKYESINPDSIDVGAETIALKSESLDANLEKQSLQKQITSHLKAFEKELESFGVDKELIFHIKQSIFEFLTNNEKDSIEPDRLIEFLKSNAPGFDALYNSHQKEAKNALNNLLKKLFVKEESVEKAFVENKSAVKDDSDTDRIRRSFEKMFVRVSEDSKDMDVKKVYKSMYEKLDTLAKALETSKVLGKEDMLMRVLSLKDNIEFVNDINRHSVYMQIPLNIMDSNTTGELYILKRDSKRKRIDPANVTVFLSLDTKSLGLVESLISINKKNISLNMRFENREVIDLFKESFQELYNSLQEMGYKLVDIKYRVIEEKVNLINANKALDSELNRFKKAIDFRI
ncbi:MAG: flagellar hook-length control protein FliK [Clostridium sp.]|nr:flagellar hook-length control protein FliK [Clostridium sp.]